MSSSFETFGSLEICRDRGLFVTKKPETLCPARAGFGLMTGTGTRTTCMSKLCTFVEAEGLTAIVPKAPAQMHGIAFEFESAMISLMVHSSLEAVGFLALISNRLAAK